jgi:hypothetical protein
MKVIPIRPKKKDPLEPPESDMGDVIVIHIVEGQVEVTSTLEDEKTVFYIDLCKQIILRDTLEGYDGYD